MLSRSNSLRRRVTAAAATLTIAAGLAGCSDSTGSNAGKLSILLTDAPGDVSQAVVTVSEIYLQGSSGRVVLMNTPVTTDLLTLANSTAELVQDAVVPAGTYTQLDFVVTGGYIQVENDAGGTEIYASSSTYAGLPAGAEVAGTLQMPSYAQTGIKVDLPGGALSINGGQKVLLVDFDVSQSFGQQAGGSGSWVMHPVLKATDFQTSGGVVVTLQKDPSVTMPSFNGTTLTLGDFSAELTNSGGSTEVLAFTDDNGDGVYEAHFQYLIPGSYTVDVSAPAGVSFTTSPAHPAAVSVGSGQDATSAFTLTSATTP